MANGMGTTYRIFLTGMPGAGKSYWASEIARHYGLSFTDLDAYIASHEGRSIHELFAMNGEAAFRLLENDYLVRLIEETDKRTVIACGGGTPCFSDNMRLMKIAGVVVYLEAGIEELYNNIMRDEGNMRPLLSRSARLREQLNTLYLRRKPYYEQAHYILPAKDISVTTFGQILGNV